ncbi:angiopoietin-1 receptor-like [Saccostrea cucullata]|uniref:angiopoietin-1 receptor-like n=1 Tax=Saccostrea cuccullata TaxID=36930 RepID=UPI002ED034B2
MTFLNLGFLLFYAYSELSAEGPCIGKEFFKGCCPHTFWNNETKDCEKCPSGFYGLNCSFSCQYPFFGDRCLSKCSCNSSLCDLTKGCISTNGENMGCLHFFPK